MDIKNVIQRARQLNLSARQIAFILELPQETVQNILERNGWATSIRPGCMPDSYFISQLSSNKSIAEIANDLGCTRASIYRLLKRRGISPDAYR